MNQLLPRFGQLGWNEVMLSGIEKHIGRRMAERRRMLGFGQSAVALTLGVPRQQITKYEQGQRRLCAAELVLIARTLRVSVGFFFEGFADCAPRDSRTALVDELSGLPEDLIDSHLALVKLTAANIQRRSADCRLDQTEESAA